MHLSGYTVDSVEEEEDDDEEDDEELSEEEDRLEDVPSDEETAAILASTQRGVSPPASLPAPVHSHI